MPGRRAMWVVLWLAAGLYMGLLSGGMPVLRAQEGRVLETAREMVGHGPADWLLPRLNGRVRLRKPPLAYWASAASFSAFGVNDRAGRLPAVVAQWALLGVVFVIGRRLFTARVGLLSAAVTAGLFVPFRYGMLAETDIYAALLLTAGVYAMLRVFDPAEARTRRWAHVLAACGAGVVMAKGPPAAYLLVLALLLAWGRRTARPLWLFLTSGAVLTFLVLAAPWFAYVGLHGTQQGQLGDDLLNSAEGGDHHGPPWLYVPMLLRATLPWTGVWLVAAALAGGVLWPQAVAHWRAWRNSDALPVAADAEYAGDSAALWTLAAWAAAIFVPLCCWGNKQIHYLLPLMPPTAILIGWALDAAIRRRRGTTCVAVVTAATAAVLGATGIVELVLAVRRKPHRHPADVLIGVGLLLLAGGVASVWRRWGRERGYVALAVLAAAALGVAVVWVPSATKPATVPLAQQLQAEFPHAAFVFRNSEVPSLSYYLRRIIPVLTDADLIGDPDPHRVVFDQQQQSEHVPTPPAGYVEVGTYREGENRLHVFVPQSSATTQPATSPRPAS